MSKKCLTKIRNSRSSITSTKPVSPRSNRQFSSVGALRTFWKRIVTARMLIDSSLNALAISKTAAITFRYTSGITSSEYEPSSVNVDGGRPVVDESEGLSSIVPLIVPLLGFVASVRMFVRLYTHETTSSSVRFFRQNDSDCASSLTVSLFRTGSDKIVGRHLLRRRPIKLFLAERRAALAKILVSSSELIISTTSLVQLPSILYSCSR
ncbi:hypothetical protein OGATHE_005544 [Ogataea polymorpha]|uniref:Uncharacterized protein n=1 Tax=Ogataea polymorpha TaxID=460523 RepID=A0A9P8NUA1_9ASCO|nr:hypothetical protein OGATHE_005544 [Ogataea polymorpha]